MSHTGGGGGHGHHGHHGGQGGHPDQSAGWNSALQGGNKPITSLPNPTLWPIVFALGVFVLMLLPFCINWGDGGVELPWANKHAQPPADEAAMAPNDGYQQQAYAGQSQNQEQLQGQTQDLSAPVAAQTAAATPAAPVSYQQQLMYASQQAYAPASQSTAQSTTQPVASASYAAQAQGQTMSQGQAQYNQYATQNYNQSQPAYQAPPQRHRVWVDR